MDKIDRSIFAELWRSQFTDRTRDFYLQTLTQLRQAGAQAAILGCTEIGLLLEGMESPLALIDSAEEHVAMGLEWVLG